MTAASTKPFAPIRDDYLFFQEHSTEAAEDVRAYLPYVKELGAAHRRVRMLDFGCGDGQFTAALLLQAGFPPHNLRLSLVEPDSIYLEQAVKRLQPYTTEAIEALPQVRPGVEADLVLANHVFYYVPQLEEMISVLLGTLAQAGRFLIAMAGERNTLIQFWKSCFALIGKPLPFHIAEDLQRVLDVAGRPYKKHDVWYRLAFPDSEDNRLSMMRFLMGDYFSDVPRQAMIGLFDPYTDGQTVAMQIVHEHFVIDRP
jgi:SAM-dependent methyltransferase